LSSGSSTAAAIASEPPRKPKGKSKKRIGRARTLDKRVEPKPDGRYLIYYKPS